MTGEALSIPSSAGNCRFCSDALTESVIDLGATPPANAYLEPAMLNEKEPSFPLHAYLCGSCKLMQLQAFQTPDEIFGDYAYFSSYSSSWLDHAERYAAAMVDRFEIDADSHVVEIASNDGYLLQFFRDRGIPVLGIEPAANVAQAAEAKGIPSITEFFGKAFGASLARDGKAADLMIANNVMAHVPDLNDFVAGFAEALKPEGVLTIEFPHLLRLLQSNQFDTIYHEHFSYFSFTTAERILAAHGLRIFDVEELPTHGGSLRLFVAHDDAAYLRTTNVDRLLKLERKEKLDELKTYRRFAKRAQAVRRDLRSFLEDARCAGKTVAGYGAPAKGNTLLNYCGIDAAHLPFTVDANPHKQGRLLPGSHIPIVKPDAIRQRQPDYVLILPWNIKDEIMETMAFIREWGGRFVVPIPEVTVLP